ncbi:MAG TPA: dicarboxylate/amino acid:cation symporter [Gemmatimonadaceae bacterium]|jgi:Na+/H+-dicarboxylate symporter|nr:dicarboxylate/amino acid:cation symporter [Gemmatimonadaceae bacterium]
MSLTVRVLLGLVAGLALGFAVNASPGLSGVVPWIEPLGSIFINAIRMTVVPLVVASLIVGVAGAPDARAIGRVGWRALVLFVILVLAGAVFGAIVAQPILARMIDPASASALSAGSAGDLAGAAREGAQRLPTFAQWLIDLVPANPVRAAADGAMLPLIVFSLLFGVSLLRLDAERRRPVIGFFEGVADAMLVLVRWVLAFAPIGVFALAVPLAARMGLAAAGALVGFIVLVSALSVAFMALVLYPAAAVGGRVTLGAFARAIAPSQAVAFSSRSSLAALPAMIEAAETRLGFPPEVSRFLLPLSASTFRAGSGVGLTVSVLFVARLYGVDLSAAQMATVIATVVLTSFSVPGIPNGSIIAMVPILVAARIPVEGIGILLSIDTIPDMFRTTTNVTGHMTVASILSRFRSRALAPAAEAAAATTLPEPTKS